MMSRQRSISSISLAWEATYARQKAAKKSNTGSSAHPFCLNQAVSRPGQRLLVQRGHEERDNKVIEHAHNEGVVTARLGDGQRIVGQGLATFERAPVGE